MSNPPCDNCGQTEAPTKLHSASGIRLCVGPHAPVSDSRPARRSVTVTESEKNADFMERLLGDCVTLEKLREKTSEELAAMLIDHVWADVEMLTPKAALIEVCVERLRSKP